MTCLYLRGERCDLWDEDWENPNGCNENGNCIYANDEEESIRCSDFEHNPD